MRTPSKTPQAAFADCVDAVGVRSEASAGLITSINRGLFKTWLVANGVPSADVVAMTLPTIKELWADSTDEALSMWVQAPANTNTSNAADSKAKRAADAIRDLIGAAHMDESRVIELINEHGTKTVRHELTLPSGRTVTLPDEAFHPVFPEVLAAVSAGLNVLLVGPAGSGKTHLCEQVAKALGLSFSFTGAVMQEHKLLGFRNPQGEMVRTTFRDRYEHGGLFLFDEMDASSAQALLAFNSGLANGAQDFPDACVSRHCDFRAIASANTFGTGATAKYIGRNPMDAASRDRFYMIVMGYDAATERTIYLNEKPLPVSLFTPRRLSEKERADWVSYVHTIRANVEKLGAELVVSGRAIASGLKALEAGIPRAAVENAVLWKGADAATQTKIKAGY